ncbi:hypothetical protein EN842_55885, partial [bacterium M00.F.Ca.ET.199.01.1.1]
GGGIKYFHANSTLADSTASGTDSVAIGPASVASGTNSPSCSCWLERCASSLRSRLRATRSAARWKTFAKDQSRSSRRSPACSATPGSNPISTT